MTTNKIGLVRAIIITVIITRYGGGFNVWFNWFLYRTWCTRLLYARGVVINQMRDF